MNFNTLKKFHGLWEQWEIRSMLLYSLGTQAILTFLAPLRKRSSSKPLSLLLWLLYTVADSIAFTTIGLIAHDRYVKVTFQKDYLIGLWAPFLILHLGGPDTITALQYEDIATWNRQGLHLIGQFGITIVVFARSLTREHVLLLPTLLVFFDGLIKYIERVCGLYFASFPTLNKEPKRKPGLESVSTLTRVEGVEHGSSDTPVVEPEASGGTVTARHDEQDDHDRDNGANSTNTCEETDETINDAYAFCTKFKGLLNGSFVSSEDFDQSRGFYLRLRPFEALKMLQIELGFMYDLFYTKAFLLQWKVFYIRVFCSLSIIMSLLTFCFIDKEKYQSTDIMVTYILLVGAVALDVSSMIMFLMSDWWVVTAYSEKIPKFLPSLMFVFLKWSKRARSLSRSRSPNSVSQLNLLKKCLKDHSPLLNMLPESIKEPLVEWLNTDHNRLDAQLANFVISELQAKARLATDILSVNEVCSARGNLVFEEKYCLVGEYLRPWTVDVDYEKSLLTWHFATDICYRTCTNKDDKYVQFSKTLSDYMSYVLLHQQDLVSTLVGESGTRFDDTREEAKKFMSNQLMFYPSEQGENLGTRNKLKILLEKLGAFCGRKRAGTSLEQFCADILKVPTLVSPKMAKGIKSKSVLFDSCRLAKQLKLFGESQWEITCKVWVELLSYAAVNCSRSHKSHVILLSKGGQLMTLVWLLMLHLGFRKINKNPTFFLTKLVIPKQL